MSSARAHQIIGVCRFSYPSLGGFAGATLPLPELEAQLFAPDRLRRRFALFETLTLPSFAAQTDQDFTLVVLIGEGLPPRFKKRLRGLAETYPFLRISSMEPAGPLVSTRRAYRRGLVEGTEFVTGFRIDDDDAVARDYIARTREVADRALAEGWADRDTPFVIAFHRGIYWDMGRTGRPFHEFVEKTPLGLAMSMTTGVDSQVNAFRWNHRRVPAHARCWTDPGPVMFLRTLHGTNDSDRSVPRAAVALDTEETFRILAPGFGIDPEAARSLMANAGSGVAP